MKWLTISEINRRSKTAKGALKVSYEHWNQLYTATAKELRAKYKRTRGYIILSTYCGLCVYYTRRYGVSMKCEHCVFGENHECGCGKDRDLWRIADDALADWINESGDWHTWKRACKALRDKLKELMDDTHPKEKI